MVLQDVESFEILFFQPLQYRNTSFFLVPLQRSIGPVRSGEGDNDRASASSA